MTKVWTPNPPDARLRARLLDGSIIEYFDLKVGDIFQAVDPEGTLVNLMDGHEPDDSFG